MEIWKEIIGHPNYVISNTGRVKRLAHIGKHALYGDRKMQEREMRLIDSLEGYKKARIGNKFKFVHVLVLENFVSPRPNGMQCCHNNGIPYDNRLINLRWDTPKNNVHDRRFHGTYQYGTNNPNAKYSDELIEKIRFSNLTAKQCEKEFNVPQSYIYSIRLGYSRRKNGRLNKLDGARTPREST